MTAGLALVALPLPLEQPYTYRVPETLADRAVPGARVVVPVRQRELIGIVTGLTDQAPVSGLRDMLAAPDPTPSLSAELLELAGWISGYYAAPLGLTLKAMLPAALWGASRVVVVRHPSPSIGGLAGKVLELLDRKGGEATTLALSRGLKRPVWDPLDRLVRVGAVTLRTESPDTDADRVRERLIDLVAGGPALPDREGVFKRAPAQRAAYEALEELGGSAPLSHLVKQLHLSAEALRALVRRGLARVRVQTVLRDPFRDVRPTPPPASPTPAQATAIAATGRLAPGKGALLLGVTGSGKTMVYLEAVRRELEAGRGAIILVPEIGLTPQTVSRVRGAFGDEVAVLHSALSEGERADQWRTLRSGQRRVVVGARSAVFAPVRDLGLVVVDEEHEASYKNGEAPRYHARDVAQVRARMAGARFILGSATPSLEAMARAPAEIALLTLPERAGTQPLPPVELVDLRTARHMAEAGPLPWSEPLDQAVTGALARGEQVLLLLNRRGYAAMLQCPGCGAVRTCPRCSISLTVHQAPAALRCHYCGHDEPMAPGCPQCGHRLERMRGVGTQQLERFLAQRFGEARLARMDLDTTSARWSHQTILDRVERGDVDILLGTQMVAKGLDFPNVTLVGVVDADTGLYLPDFRSAERTFQLLAQVAGRAGRGPRGGKVIIQTRNPGHEALTFAARHETIGFLARELEVRRDPPYPPHAALANVLVSGERQDRVADHASRVAGWFAALAASRQLELAVLGPAPCPLERIKDRWRWHVVLRGAGEIVGRVVRYAAGRLPETAGVRVVVDRDPVSLL
jgi:primosomal protein N' (replication factor Y) (superfamily II helicase)